MFSVHLSPGCRLQRPGQPSRLVSGDPRAADRGQGRGSALAVTNKAGNWRGLVELQIGYLNIRLPGLLPIETHAPVPRHGPPLAEHVFGYSTCGNTVARRPPLTLRAGVGVLVGGAVE